jgi:hypothetical protein
MSDLTAEELGELEDECLECGRPLDEHALLHHGGGSYSRICGFFTPKPPAPKAKRGVRYGSEVLCSSCAEVFCPSGERLHFHHDGCPACYGDDLQTEDDE